MVMNKNFGKKLTIKLLDVKPTRRRRRRTTTTPTVPHTLLNSRQTPSPLPHANAHNDHASYPSMTAPAAFLSSFCRQNGAHLFRFTASMSFSVPMPCQSHIKHLPVTNGSKEQIFKLRRMHVRQRCAWKRQDAMEPVCTYMFPLNLHWIEPRSHEMCTPVRGATLEFQNTRRLCRLGWSRLQNAKDCGI